MATPKQGYRAADGQKVPSVTTVLGRFKDSGGLIKWAYKQGREHENLVNRNLPAPAHLYDVTAKAAEAGTIAHDMIEQFILVGQDEAIAVWDRAAAAAKGGAPDVMTKALNSYQQFRKWWKQTNIHVTDTELGLVSERHRFGGTPDAIGTEGDGTIVLIDWKTSNAVYGEYLIQLAAYAILLEENGWGPFKGFHLLRFAKESADFAHHHYGDLTREKKAFLLMRELYDDVYAIEKRA